MAETRFFCENCNTNVPMNAMVCPGCGNVFESVKCPACSYVAKFPKFRNGCPKCGFLKEDKNGKRGVAVSTEEDGPESKTSMPNWVFVLISVGLFAILLIMVIVLLVVMET